MHGVWRTGFGALLRMQPALLVDVDGLARAHVAQQLEAALVERDALRGDHVLAAARRVALADHQRPDAVRIAEADDAVTEDHRDDGVAADDAAIRGAQRGENVRGRRARRAEALQLAREHVEQHFGIRRRVEVAAIFADQHVGELRRVGQVAVVREADAVRRVDVERLRLGRAVATGRRIAHVADADVALQLQHVPLLEHVAHEADVLAQEQLAFVLGHDARGILAAVLQHGQRVIDLLVDRAETDDADDSAHACALRCPLAGVRRRACLPVST